MKVPRVLILCLLCASNILLAEGNPGKFWGQTKALENSIEQIGFKLFRNNIWGQDFSLTLAGECTYYADGQDPVTAENTFTIRGGDFPDLLVNRRGKITTDVVDAVSDTGHRGTLAISCNFRKRPGERKYSSASCNFQFDSPVREGQQLDACIASANLGRIKPSRN